MKLFGNILNDPALALVTEYCDLGDMSCWINEAHGESIDDERLLHLLIVLEAYIQLGEHLQNSTMSF